MIAPNSEATRLITSRLLDPTLVNRARIHPLACILAAATYRLGHGIRGHVTWTPVPAILDALTDAFYLALPATIPIPGRTFVAIDVSGSMYNSYVDSGASISCAEAAGVMSLVFMAASQNVDFIGFHTKPVDLPISRRQRLDDVIRTIRQAEGGGTDCAIPFKVATKVKAHVDTFVILTDSETWAGRQHPAEALKQYRREVNPDAKVAILSMAATNYTVGDITDRFVLQGCGLDTAIPSLVADLASGGASNATMDTTADSDSGV